MVAAYGAICYRIATHPKQRRDFLGRVLVQTGDNVRVRVERDADIRVPEPLLHNLRVDAFLEGEGGPTVPQIVQPDRRQAEPPHSVGKAAGEPFRMQHRAVDVAKHKIVIGPAWSDQQRSAGLGLRCSRSAATVPGVPDIPTGDSSEHSPSARPRSEHSPSARPRSRTHHESRPDRAVFGISRASAYEAVRNGQIPSITIGRRRVVPTAAVRRVLGLDGGTDKP
jgi:hypothetical protein